MAIVKFRLFQVSQPDSQSFSQGSKQTLLINLYYFNIISARVFYAEKHISSIRYKDSFVFMKERKTIET